MAEVSVIVPVYNKEKYIGALLEELLGQTFADIEIICVDNNSTDSSAGIVEKYAAGDSRIRLIAEGKQGVSAARNAGIKAAGGRYVIFTDADDEVETDYVKTLYDRIEGSGADMAACGYTTFYESQPVKTSPKEERPLLYANEAIERLFKCKYYEGYLWNKILKLDIIREKGLWFDEDISRNEDRLFLVRYLLNAESLAFVYSHQYCYHLRDDAATAGLVRDVYRVSEEELTEFDAFERMVELLQGRSSVNEEYRDAYEACVHDMILSELRTFRRMVSLIHGLEYARSHMRHFARQCRKYSYEPTDATEAKLYRVYRRYGLTGLSCTWDPMQFEYVGRLE